MRGAQGACKPASRLWNSMGREAGGREVGRPSLRSETEYHRRDHHPQISLPGINTALMFGEASLVAPW